MNFKSSKSLVAVVLGCLLLTAFASPGSADSKSDLERKKDGVSGKIGGAQKEYDQSSKKFADATAALRRAQASLDTAQSNLSLTRGKLAVARAQDTQMQAKLDSSEATLSKSITDLKSGEKTLSNSELQVQQFTLQSLRDGNRGLRAFGDLLRGASPSSFSERMSLNNSVGDAQLATMQRLDASKVMLRLKRDKVRTLRDEVATSRRQAAANLVVKQSLETRATAQTAQVGKLVDARASAKSSARKVRAEDAAQLRELEAERNRLSARLRALAAAELAKAKKHKAGDTPGGGSPPSNGGSSTLYSPVNGPVTSPYGMRVHPVTGVYKLHDGTDIGASCGTRIKAAASGTIIERYYNGGYGNRLIVNHGIIRGVNVVTTYNHAAGYIVNVGQRVSRGQTIGYVGRTGYSTGCHLHFMVITNGSTVNPMGWL